MHKHSNVKHQVNSWCFTLSFNLYCNVVMQNTSLICLFTETIRLFYTITARLYFCWSHTMTTLCGWVITYSLHSFYFMFYYITPFKTNKKTNLDIVGFCILYIVLTSLVTKKLINCFQLTPSDKDTLLMMRPSESKGCIIHQLTAE